MKALWIAVPVLACSTFALTNAAHAEEIFTDVSSPLAPFTVVSSIAVQNPVPAVTLLSPNNGVYYPGETVTVSWDTSGLGASFVNVLISWDGGMTYEELAHALPSYATYTWTVPSVVSREVKFGIEATDLVDVVATDVSDGMIATTVLPVVAPSPVTGDEEWVSLVQPGDYVVAPGFPNTVYYVNEYMERQPFLDGETLLTYDSPEAELSAVTDATLPTLPLWYPMVPKPGSVLVRFADSPNVYAVEGTPESPFLRWIVNDVIATLNYGEEWEQYVMEISPVLRNSYLRGSDVVSNIAPDTSLLLKPAEIAEQWAEIEQTLGITL